VIEILSPSNTAIEMHRKLDLYQGAKVREYWVIDPEEKFVEVYCLDKGRYKPHILRVDDTLQSTLFPGLAIPLGTVFAG
jgi:Uma2 family endonuclease